MRSIAVAVLFLCGALEARAQQTVSLSPSKDNTLYGISDGSLSNGAGTSIFAGTSATGFVRRALVAFDVQAAIPPGSAITAASLQLTMDMTGSGSVPIALHRVIADWGEGASVATGGGGGGGAGGPAAPGDATWLHRFSSHVFWAAQGGDFAPVATATTSVGGTGLWTWTSAGLVAEVQGWLDGSVPNFGWLIKSPEGPNDAKRFGSRERALASEQPHLVVTFVPPSAAVVLTGTGCSGTSGIPLSLSAIGLPVLGNPNFAVVLHGVPYAQTQLYLAQGLEPVPVALGSGCSVYLSIASVYQLIALNVSPFGPVPLDASGGATIPVPVPNSFALSGVHYDIQAIAPDATIPFGFTTSNAMSVTFGF